jgi:hypothetical protein
VTSQAEDVAKVQEVATRINAFKLDRGTTNMTIFNHVVTSVQEYYRQYHRIPDAKAVLESGVRSTHPSVCRIMASPGFEKAMEARGIPTTSTNGLSPQQSILLSLLTNPADRRPLNARLKAVGINYHTYRNWLRNPLFANAINREAETTLQAHTGDVLTQLTSKAVGGDLNAIKFHLEVSGRHDPNGNKGPDAQVIVARVLEIIMRRVKDPLTLKEISGDLELLALGDAVSAPQPHSVVVGQPVMASDSEIDESWVDPSTPQNEPRPKPEALEAAPTAPQTPQTPEEWLTSMGLSVVKPDSESLNFDLPEMEI